MKVLLASALIFFVVIIECRQTRAQDFDANFGWITEYDPSSIQKLKDDGCLSGKLPACPPQLSFPCSDECLALLDAGQECRDRLLQYVSNPLVTFVLGKYQDCMVTFTATSYQMIDYEPVYGSLDKPIEEPSPPPPVVPSPPPPVVPSPSPVPVPVPSPSPVPVPSPSPVPSPVPVPSPSPLPEPEPEPLPVPVPVPAPVPALPATGGSLSSTAAIAASVAGGLAMVIMFALV
jgi:hypothetical protein